MANRSGLLQADKSARTPGSQNLSGTFTGCIKCAPTTLTLHQEGGTFHGRFNIGGNEYQLAGSFNGGSATGELTDPHAGTGLAFELTVTGNQMIFRLAIPDPSSGQILTIVLRFQRSGREARIKHKPQNHNERQYDPVLAGGWIRQNARTNGAGHHPMLCSRQTTIELRIDGTYTCRDAETEGNDPSTKPLTLCCQGASPGKWYTRDHRLYLSEPESSSWICYARYQVKRGKLYLSFEDDACEVWARR